MTAVLQGWTAFVVLVMLVYAVRHWVLSLARLSRAQRPYPLMVQGDCPGVTVLVPMHNEERVAAGALTALLASEYPADRLEIIPIDDHSGDATPEILRRFAAEHPQVRPLHRRAGLRGKPAGLNEALALASHDIVLVFDADYQPHPGLVRELSLAFADPEVGAVMGRVIPRNAGATFLTRLLDLERAGGYQVDQQARYTLDLVPQYGGTVGGFRRSVVTALGGFDPRVLAEDTDLTVRLVTHGWRVAYANRAECYEESPETWDVRFRQLRRWARGHTQVLLRHAGSLPGCPYFGGWQKVDLALLLALYLVPPILLTGVVASVGLFLTGGLSVFHLVGLSVFLVAYNAFGNFAPFYQIAGASLLDGSRERLNLIPYLFFMYVYNTWAVTCGTWDALADICLGRLPVWDKTQRFRS